MLHNELQKDVFLCDDVNTSFNAFISTTVHYFKRAFPPKIIYVNYQNDNKWITQGLKSQVKERDFFNSLNRITNISRELLDYINRYQITYDRLIKEAKKRENDNLFWGLKLKQTQCGK